MAGNIFLRSDNSALGIDDITTARLGFLKKLGQLPTLLSDSGNPIIFSQTNQIGIHTNISGATITERMRITSTGSVGIGTINTGSYKLAVAGKIAAVGEVKVFIAGTTTFPDYVFKPNYRLTPLAEVEKYINENGHLPEVPSATEVEQDGLSLNEMSIILLKKVEEMTLHLIELKKENELLQNRIKKLENEKVTD